MGRLNSDAQEALIDFLVERQMRRRIFSGPFSGGGSDFAEELIKLSRQHFRQEITREASQPDSPRRSRIVHT